MVQQVSGDSWSCLAPRELRKLQCYEAAIARAQGPGVAQGMAMAGIRDAGLYRAGYATFATYCRDRWAFDPHAVETVPWTPLRSAPATRAVAFGMTAPTARIRRGCPGRVRGARELALAAVADELCHRRRSRGGKSWAWQSHQARGGICDVDHGIVDSSSRCPS